MEIKNEVTKENITNESNNTDENVKEVFLNKSSTHKNKSNLYLNLQKEIIKNKKFIEEIFQYSNELNELMPIFKENSNEKI